MKKSKANKRFTLGLLGTAFVLIGTYNSVVVNSDEFMDHQQVRFVKRLDEIYGVVKTGRVLANHGQWTKLANRPVERKFVSAVAAPQKTEAPAPVVAAAPELNTNAAIQEELSLELNEVFNAKKYANPPKAGDFSGSLSAREGVIESINVSLPQGESFSVAFSEMSGNVFEYDQDGETFSGMIYQMDKSSYMVTLTNGPHEGTRLKFGIVKEEEIGNNSASVAENNYASESVQAEEAPEFAPVVSDNGEVSEVGVFGGGNQPVTQAVQEAEIAQAPVAEDGASFDEMAQQNAHAEQVAQGGFNFGGPANL